MYLVPVDQSWCKIYYVLGTSTVLHVFYTLIHQIRVRAQTATVHWTTADGYGRVRLRTVEQAPGTAGYGQGLSDSRRVLVRPGTAKDCATAGAAGYGHDLLD